MKKILSKIVLIFVFGSFIYSCSSIKKVPDGSQLLVKNTIVVNNKATSDERLQSLLSQKPNSRLPLLGFPLRLNMYNMAKDNPDSLYYNWLNRKPERRNNMAKFLSNKQVDRLSESFVVSGLYMRVRILLKSAANSVVISLGSMIERILICFA
ncbi:MAG: hypothetical protein MUF43_07165, partial [Flavobacterium sp.]|nr:hypothetical protein [Flavobacterium sp.]